MLLLQILARTDVLGAENGCAGGDDIGNDLEQEQDLVGNTHSANSIVGISGEHNYVHASDDGEQNCFAENRPGQTE